MPLHEHYFEVRALVDHHFVGYRRRCVADALTQDRIELWHDLLEAGLRGAGNCSGGPGDVEWENCILEDLERRYQELRSRGPA